MKMAFLIVGMFIIAGSLSYAEKRPERLMECSTRRYTITEGECITELVEDSTVFVHCDEEDDLSYDKDSQKTKYNVNSINRTSGSGWCTTTVTFGDGNYLVVTVNKKSKFSDKFNSWDHICTFKSEAFFKESKCW